MENKKIIETIKELNKKLIDPESINLFVDFYERLLSDSSSINDLSSIMSLYCLYNPETKEVVISDKKTMNSFTNPNNFVFKVGSELVDLIQENNHCYVAAKDFKSMPLYKTSDRLEALTFIAKEGMKVFKPIVSDRTSWDDSLILDKAYDQTIPFSILELDQKVEVSARWLEQVNPGKSKEFFEGLDSFDDVKNKLLNFEVKRCLLFDDDVLRPILILEKLMEKDLISKSLYLEKISEFYELKKDLELFNKHNVNVIFTWIINSPIYKDPNSNSNNFNMMIFCKNLDSQGNPNNSDHYKLDQLSKIPKDVLLKFLKTINTLNKRFFLNESYSEKITNPIIEVL